MSDEPGLGTTEESYTADSSKPNAEKLSFAFLFLFSFFFLFLFLFFLHFLSFFFSKTGSPSIPGHVILLLNPTHIC